MNIILSLVYESIIYWILQNYDEKAAFKFSFVATIIEFILKNISLINISMIIGLIVAATIRSLLTTILSVWVFNRTNSFFTYLLLSIAIVVVFIGGFAFIISGLMFL